MINEIIQDRQDLALIYRSKSDESIAAAQECLYAKHYRAVCNRAWYAIYQAVSAGAFARLDKQTRIENQAFNHHAVESLFNSFLRSAQLRLRHAHLLECLKPTLRARIVADYLPDSDIITAADAESSMATARRVRQVIWEVLQWQ